MARFFLAVAPPAPLLSEIDAFRGRWGHPHHKVEPHITIQPPFEWEGSPEPWLQAVYGALRQVAPFPVQIEGTGRFARSRVLFLTPKGEGLGRLHALVTGALADLLPPDDRRRSGQGFHAHLTLAAGRFGITDERIDAMEAEARREPFAAAGFTATSLRAYRWGDRRWERFKDLPFGQ
jgi:2'-5' RNA ligase